MTTKLLRTLMGMVALVAMLTACSSEDVILDEPNAKNEITFNVTTNRASRAFALYDAQSLPSSFNLNAWIYTGAVKDGKIYMDDDVVTNSGTNSNPIWKNNGGLRYWPNEANQRLNFYAHTSPSITDQTSPRKETFAVDPTSGTAALSDIEQPADAASQLDFMYAVAYNKKKTSRVNETPVSLQFKHAMTQVVFDANTASDKLYIEISEIGFVNVHFKGTFVFPSNDTEDGHWASSMWGHDGQADSYAKFDPISVYHKSTPTKLTYSENRTSGSLNSSSDSKYKTALMMFPCTYLQESIISGDNPSADNDWIPSWAGAYIRVKCAIWNIAKPDATKENGGFKRSSDVILHGSIAESGDVIYEYLYIPVVYDFSDQMGKRVIFHLNFGTGNAGYTTSGERCIEGVTYQTTVAPWLEGDDEEAPDINNTQIVG